MNDLLFQEHQTSLQGISQDEAKKRLEFYGPNELKSAKRKSYLIQFLEEFKDLMVVILMIASILALIAGEITDAVLIIIIVFINALIGFLQKFKAEKAIEALKKLIAPTAKVLRNNIVYKIEARTLVPGDIMMLEEGDHIAADCIVFEENELETQEAPLTGESIAVEKNCYDGSIKSENTLFMGTTVVHGTGKAVVIKTGMDTEMGKIATLTTQTKKDKTPLEKELEGIGIFAGKITLIISVILFFFGIFIQKRNIIDTLLFATSVAVAAVPEGLPTTITIALAVGVQHLARKNAIVKQLSSVETLGATTVICSDKTGTLTKNEMTVKELYCDGFYATIDGSGYKPEGNIIHNHGQKTPLSCDLLIKAAALCNNASLTQTDGVWNMVGDPTEGALMTLARKSHLNVDELGKEYEKLHEYPFDSTRKCMTVIMKERSTGKIFAFTKGAPQSIFAISRHLMTNDRVVLLDKKTHEEFTQKKEKMAREALRVLAFAYKELSIHEQKLWEKTNRNEHISADKESPLSKEHIEKDLTFLGITGMIDPPRPEIKKAIELTKKAGMRVYIITGDEGLTAEAIGKEIGLFEEKISMQGPDHKSAGQKITNQQNLILTGKELEELSDGELKNFLSRKDLAIIFARVSPTHKLRIVSLLKELGEVVAVTGDGVNDAPALKRSDIGVAMGSGTDVSKEAANMILTDDSFSTIVKAIEQGRTIYENLKKFIFFIFSSNISEVMTIFCAILLNLPAPLTAILILCINLFTDVLPALALAFEPMENDIMLKKPRRPEEKILNRPFLIRMIGLGIVMGLMGIGLFVWELVRNGWQWGQILEATDPRYIKATTLTFAFLVLIQMAHAFNSKSEKISLITSGITKNLKLVGAVIISIIVMVGMVEIPFLQQYFHTTSLAAIEWIMLGLSCLSIIVIEEIRKYFSRRKNLPIN